MSNYIKSIEQIEPYVSTYGRYNSSPHTPTRFVVVEDDAVIPVASELGVVANIALLTNWEVDAEWHYADRGGLVMSLPGNDERLELDYKCAWEKWCEGHGFRPYLNSEYRSSIVGRNVSIDLLVGDLHSKRTANERLRSFLELHCGLYWEGNLSLGNALKTGIVRFTWSWGATLRDEIIVISSRGIEAFRIHIGDTDADDYEAMWG